MLRQDDVRRTVGCGCDTSCDDECGADPCPERCPAVCQSVQVGVGHGSRSPGRAPCGARSGCATASRKCANSGNFQRNFHPVSLPNAQAGRCSDLHTTESSVIGTGYARISDLFRTKIADVKISSVNFTILSSWQFAGKLSCISIHL